MQAAAKRAAPLAVGVGSAAVAAANSTAECRSAVVVTKEQLEEACGLIKNAKGHALFSDVTDSTPWTIGDRSTSDSQDFDLLELSASVAADLTVQRVLKEKYEQHGLASLSIESWPSSLSPSPLSSPAFSMLLDGGVELESENALLKEENERLKHENERLRHKHEAAPLGPAAQPESSPEAAAAHPMSSEKHREEHGEKRDTAPGLASEPAVSLPSAPPLATVLRLHLEDGGRVCARVGTQEAQEAQKAGQPRPRKSQQAKEKQRQAVIVATAIVVGLLAIAITKNPAKAKVAAASAAAAITSLMATYARTK